jgi:hypothetical protein
MQCSAALRHRRRDFAWIYPRPVLTLLANWGVVIPARLACITESKVGPDRDHDGIPTYYVATFACRNVATTWMTWTVHGTMFLNDHDDRMPSSGYRLTLEDFAVEKTWRIAGYPQWTEVQNAEGVLDLTRTSVDYYGLHKAYRVETKVVTTAGVVMVRGSIDVAGDWAYLPENVTSPFYSGLLKGEGVTNLLRDGVKSNVTYFTDPFLRYRRACKEMIPGSLGFDKGAIKFVSPTESARFEFLHCGAVNIEYGGGATGE